MINQAVKRVRQMERLFDMLQKSMCEDPNGFREDASFAEGLRILTEYYQSGQWLKDYELDEKGLFPNDLKRGVLAQDSVFDFLERVKGAEV